MRFLKRSKTLILHIPRTGGTWIEHALICLDIPTSRWAQASSVIRKHGMLGHLRRDARNKPDYIAAFVRHPIAYYESMWKYIKERWEDRLPALLRRWSWHPWLDQLRLFQPDMTFDDFVFLTLKRTPSWYTRLVECYIGPRGGEWVDFVGRTEWLIDDFVRLINMREHNISDRVCELRGSGRPNSIGFEIQWSEDLKQQVLACERPVIERFYLENVDG